MNFKKYISESGWITPQKFNSKKKKRKGPKSLTLNLVLLKKISETVPESKRSALIDYILSAHFGIKYENAYPESFAKSYGEKRLWDSSGYYKELDRNDPGRFSTRSKRKKQFSYKDFMQSIK